MPTRRYRVSGSVQGVGFRWYVVHQAEARNLRGFVRNLPDGRVEVLADGADPELLDFEGALRRGPPHALVTNLEIEEVSAPVHLPRGFGVAR